VNNLPSKRSPETAQLGGVVVVVRRLVSEGMCWVGASGADVPRVFTGSSSLVDLPDGLLGDWRRGGHVRVMLMVFADLQLVSAEWVEQVRTSAGRQEDVKDNGAVDRPCGEASVTRCTRHDVAMSSSGRCGGLAYLER